MGRLLGIDPGTRRIGVALSDPSGSIASPYSTIEARDEDADVQAIAAVAAENDVEEIVVGYPKKMDGTPGPAAEAASSLADRLRDRTGIAVTLWDERLSSVQADRAMLGQGEKRRTRREATDRVAAAIVLQSYLDAKRSRS